MNSINVQDIIRLLGPTAGNGLIWNIFIYVIFFFTLIALFMQGDRALLTTIILAASLLLCLVDKLVIFRPKEFGTLVIHCGMFLFPALVAGMTRDGKSRAPAILAAVIGAVYFFMFWVFLQRT